MIDVFFSFSDDVDNRQQHIQISSLSSAAVHQANVRGLISEKQVIHGVLRKTTCYMH